MAKWWAMLFPVAQAVIFGSVWLTGASLPSVIHALVGLVVFGCGVQLGMELTDACRRLGRWES